MALQIGIVGLPNVGKSTLFNALTNSKGAEAANYPFCTIEPNVGIVELPDERLYKLAEMVNPEKVIPAAIEFVDIAGLVKGASKGEGLGNQFLHAIREVDAICHCVRAFEDANITHVDGSIDPHRDRDTIEAELEIADLESVENQIDKVKGGAKSGDKEKVKALALLEKIKTALEGGTLVYDLEMTDEERQIAKSFNLLTNKPIIYAVNIAEGELGKFDVEALRTKMGLPDSTQIISISAKIEEDLNSLSHAEAADYLSELGVESSGLDKLIKAAHEALGYLTYFTAGPKEVRAWNIVKGMTAPQAAGVIHTDFEKGFIKAETIAYQDYVEHGGEVGARDNGKLRQEGKDYIVKDGDVMHFKFNV